MHALDPKTELTFESLLSSRTFAANANSSVIDLKDYVGKVAIILNVGTAIAGTNPTVDGYVMSGAESNGANMTNANVSFTQVTAAGIQTISVDTRAVNRYIKTVNVIGGTNSPNYPISQTLVGTKQVQS